jgi:hypothetical protein
MRINCSRIRKTKSKNKKWITSWLPTNIRTKKNQSSKKCFCGKDVITNPAVDNNMM